MISQNDYAGRIMAMIGTGMRTGIAPRRAGELPALYLAKAGVPGSDRTAVCEEVARRLRKQGHK